MPELFNPDHTTKHARNAPIMKDMESAKVKKAQDEEIKKLRAMAREQIQYTKRQVTIKKLNPLETLRRAKLEEKITSKVKASSKVHRQQKEQQNDGEDMDKNNEGARAGRRDTSKEGGSTNMG